MSPSRLAWLSRHPDPGRIKRQRQAMLIPRVSQRTDLSLPDCRCSVPPWEPCEHTWEPPELDAEQLEHLKSIIMPK